MEADFFDLNGSPSMKRRNASRFRSSSLVENILHIYAPVVGTGPFTFPRQLVRAPVLPALLWASCLELAAWDLRLATALAWPARVSLRRNSTRGPNETTALFSALRLEDGHDYLVMHTLDDVEASVRVFHADALVCTFPKKPNSSCEDRFRNVGA